MNDKQFAQSFFDSSKDLYSILHVPHNATIKEIKESFFRLKNTYSNQQAMYSLLEDNDVDESLNQIQNAYDILCDPVKREQYNSSLCNSSDTTTESSFATEKKLDNLEKSDVVKIHQERINSASRKSIPITQLEEGRTGKTKIVQTNSIGQSEHPTKEDIKKWNHDLNNLNTESKKLISNVKNNSEENQEFQDQCQSILAAEKSLIGSELKKTRVILGVKKEDLQENLKISMCYIDAIEANEFDKLPPLVYIKGFVSSYMKYLNIPHSKEILNNYIESFRDWEKTK